MYHCLFYQQILLTVKLTVSPQSDNICITNSLSTVVTSGASAILHLNRKGKSMFKKGY